MPTKCKIKRAEHQRRYYAKNKAYYRRVTSGIRNDVRAWLKAYKETLNCEACGEDSSSCLDFHHLDPTEKEGEIGLLLSKSGWGIERLKTEIAKCVALCSNCHRKVHAGVFVLVDFCALSAPRPIQANRKKQSQYVDKQYKLIL